MKKLCLAMVLWCLAGAASTLPPADKTESGLTIGVRAVDDDAFIDANRILMFVTNHGNFGRDLAGVFGNDFGTYYPYSGDTTMIRTGALLSSPLYAAGLWVGGKVDGQIRMALAEYNDEYVPGKIGDDDAGSPQYRVYKIYADSTVAHPNADYLAWPVDDGAPIDDQGYPCVIGQQTLWSVFNDADPVQHDNAAGTTDPLGIEIRQTVWAASGPGSDTTVTPLPLVVTHLGSTDITVEAYAVSATVTLDEYIVEIIPDAEQGHFWRLKNLSTGQILLDNQTDFSGGISAVVEGIQVAVTAPMTGGWEYVSAEPANWSQVAVAENGYAGGCWFTGVPDNGGDLFFGGVFREPHFWGSTSVAPGDITSVELRFRPLTSYTDLNANGRYDFGEPYVVDDPSQTQNAFMYSSFGGSTYEGFFPVPFTAWDISDPDNPRQINVVVRDRDQNHQWDLNYCPSLPDDSLPNSGDVRYNYLWALITDYDPTGTRYGNGAGGTIDFYGYNYGDGIWDAMWVFWLYPRLDYGMLSEEAAFRVYPNILDSGSLADSFTFVSVHPPFVAGQEDQAVYLQYKLYNKGADRIDSCFVALWSDPDLGGSGDDYVGCDTLDNLFFCYNADDDDVQYGTTPPAIGFKFLYGPMVAASNDTAYFDGGLMPGYKNLPMTSFQKYTNGTDPDDFQQSFNYLCGLTRDGLPLPNGTHYAVPGDPVTAVGDLDSAPADRRMMGTCGPFTFNPGDSQYVLIKMAVGQGTNRLASITKLRDILNGQTTLGPDRLMAILRPEPQYVFYQNAIDPIMDTVYIGRVQGSAVGEVNYGSLRINGDITPMSVGRLPEYPGFAGDVLRVVFPATPFIAGYGLLWGESTQPFVITGSFGADDPTSIGGAVRMIGHTPGDANGDRKINIGDAVYMVTYVLRDGPAPDPVAVGDANGDGRLDLGDAVYLVNYLFRDGEPPVIPPSE